MLNPDVEFPRWIIGSGTFTFGLISTAEMTRYILVHSNMGFSLNRYKT